MDKNIEYVIEVDGLGRNGDKKGYFKLDYDLIKMMLRSKSVQEMIGVILRGEIVSVYGDEIDTGISVDLIDWGETKSDQDKELRYFLDDVEADLDWDE